MNIFTFSGNKNSYNLLQALLSFVLTATQ